MAAMNRIGAWLPSFILIVICAPALADVIAIRAGAVLDPDTATSSANQTLLIEGGKITAIGNNVTVPPGGRQ